MRGRLTWLVVAAVGVLAALAIADAVRPADDERPAASTVPTTTRPPTLREELRTDDVTGALMYSDEQCLLHLLLLPSLEDELVRAEATNAPLRRCRFSFGAGRLLGNDELVRSSGGHIARCRGGQIEVLDVPTQRLTSRTPGCTPAWRPDGALTYVQDGQVLVGGTVLLSRRDLRKAANRHPNVRGVRGVRQGYPVKVRVTSLAWFDEERFAASLRIEILGVEPQYLLVVFEGRRAVASAASFTGPFGKLTRSPAGSYVADEDGTIIAEDGVTTDVAAGVPRGRAVAFSPDERWVVLVTPGSTLLVATPLNDEVVRTLRLPFAAKDAVWEPGGPVVDLSRAG